MLPLSPTIISGGELDQISLGPKRSITSNESLWDVKASQSYGDLDLFSCEDLDDLIENSLSVFSRNASQSLLPPITRPMVPKKELFKDKDHKIELKPIHPVQFTFGQEESEKDFNFKGNDIFLSSTIDTLTDELSINSDDLPDLHSSLSKVNISLDNLDFENTQLYNSRSIIQPIRGKSLQLTSNSLSHSNILKIQNSIKRNFKIEGRQISRGSQFISSPNDLEEVNFQVHKKVMGWKLTSVDRRNDLIDFLDFVNNKDLHRMKLKSKKEKRNIVKHLNKLDSNPMISIVEGTQNIITDDFESQSPQEIHKLTIRKSDSWKNFVNRSINSRKGYRNLNSIKALMEERKKVEQSKTQIFMNKYNNNHLSNIEYLDQGSILSVHDRMGVIMDEKSVDDLMNSSTFGNQPPSFIPKPMFPSHPPKNQSSPSKQLYNFPVNIYRTRDRKDIIESVNLRNQLEAKILTDEELEKDKFVDAFIEGRTNARLNSQESGIDLEDDELSQTTLSSSAIENEFGLSEAILKKWGDSDNDPLLDENCPSSHDNIELLEGIVERSFANNSSKDNC